MIKTIISTAMILFLLTSCNKTNVTITGNIKEAGKQKIYLEQLNVDNATIIDSTESRDNGEFKFKTFVEQPTFFNIKVGPKETITFIAEADEKIELSGTFKGLSQNYWVDGSENSLWIKLLNFQLNNTVTQLDSLRERFTSLAQNKDTKVERSTILHAWDSTINKQIQFSKDFILKHAVSPASYYALYQKFDNDNFIINPAIDLQPYKIVASSLKAMYPESQYTKAILKHLQQIAKELQNERIRQIIANSETTLPEISLPDVKHDTITLSSLKGKFIILDFTALSAKEGKAYIKDMKSVYQKFKNKGLQIYQVCLDENQTLWERLVQQYNIDWVCVHDSQNLRSCIAQTWNVQNIPANYIINPKFEIVGKNLMGKRLEERLNNLMK